MLKKDIFLGQKVCVVATIFQDSTYIDMVLYWQEWLRFLWILQLLGLELIMGVYGMGIHMCSKNV